MEYNDISAMVASLLSAPSRATLDTLKSQRQIWSEWIEDISKIIKDRDISDPNKRIIIENCINLAPTWKMNANISLGINLRVSSLKKNQGEISIGLGVGVLQASGSYGFMSQSSSESTLQAKVDYSLTNGDELTLKEYLTMTLGKDIKDIKTDELKNISEGLKSKNPRLAGGSGGE